MVSGSAKPSAASIENPIGPRPNADTDVAIEVSESEIMIAMRDFIESQHQLLEGAAGVALAAFAKVADAYKGQRVAIVICGAKIGLDKLQDVLEVRP